MSRGADRRVTFATWGLAVGLVCAASCRARPTPAPPVASAPVAVPEPPRPEQTCAPSPPPKSPATGEPVPRPLRRCFAELPAWSESPVPDLLDHAASFFEDQDDEGALACAEEAARQMPRSLEAHHDRALAFARLGRHDESRDALALLLALAPDDVESLELAADLFVNQFPPSAERAGIGLEYARRASRLASPRHKERRARLALLEGQALIDLGRAREALKPLGRAVAGAPRDVAARYELGVAFFELCRFAEARRAFEAVVALDENHPHALYHLGLLDEREGNDAGAEAHFSAATAVDNRAFPTPPAVSLDEFAARLKRAVGRLPADIIRDLEGISVEAAELPLTEDLTAESPPLSPTILGLFRGLPLGRDGVDPPPAPVKRAGQGRAAGALARPPAGGGAAACATPERAIILYRRNLLHSVRSEAELDAAIERTLLHEVGHLRGEDDGSLRDRGLE